MLDLREAVIKSLDSLIASGAIEKKIEETLAKTVASAIAEELDSYRGEFSKKLKAAVTKSLALNGELDLPSYNDAILKIVRKQVEQATHSSIQQQVAERMTELLCEPPAEIKLSALVEEYKEHIKNKHSGGCVCYGDSHEITLHIHESTAGFRYIELDDEPNKRLHQCDISIGIHRDEVFSLKFQNADCEREMFVGPLYGFERMLFQMKAAKSKLIVDCDVDDLVLSYGEMD